MRFNTPTSFTMLNGWYLDDGDGSNILSYLTGGGIDTSGYSTVADPVYMVDLDAAVTNFVPTDKDLDVQDDPTIVGPLLAYKNDYPSAGNTRVWIRDTRATPLVIADGSTVEVTTAGGTGTGTQATGGFANGDDIYHNLFTIASFTGSPNPQLYIYQNHPVDGTRTRIAEWSNLTNWDRGSIDVLIPVQLGGSLIDGGNISTFVRQTADTYTFVQSTLSAAGRTPIATETAADEVNVTVGEHYMFYADGTSPSFSAGDVIQNVATGTSATPDWYAEVVSHVTWNTSTGYLVLRGLRGSPANNDNIFVGASDSTADVNGTVGDTWVAYDTETTAPVVGDLGKPIVGSLSGAERLLRSFQDDGASGKLLLQVEHAHQTTDNHDYMGAARNPLYRAFVDNDVLTAASGGSSLLNVTLDTTANGDTLISGFSDVTVAHINGTVTVSSVVGTFELGERITWNANTSEARFIQLNGSTMTLGNVDPADEPDAADSFVGDKSTATADCDSVLTDINAETFNFNLQSAFPYGVAIQGGDLYEAGRTLEDVYAYLQFYVRDGQDITNRTIYTSDNSTITLLAGEEYISANSTFTATKAAPFGTLAGGVFFGAQGVWIEGIASADNNSIKLLDTSNTLREPFISVNVTVTNTRVDDRVAIYLEDGTSELPSKTQYTSNGTANFMNRELFDRNDSGAFPNDTPTSGTFIVVDNTLNEEHRYRYNSFNATGGTGSDGQLVLPASLDGTADGDTGGQKLTDTSETWAGVVVGDIIHRTNNTFGYAYVIDAANAAGGNVLTTLIRSSNNSQTAASSWSVGDTYQFFSLVKNYTGSDTFFIPYMDTIEDTGTDGSPGDITVSLTYVADREIILEVRNVEAATEIVAFKTTGTITNGGYTQGVIRNEDTVFTP